MQRKQVDLKVRVAAISIAALIALLWASHVLTYFWHGWPFLCSSRSWPWYVFPPMLLVLSYLYARTRFSSFDYLLGLTSASIVGLPVLLYFFYLVPKTILNILNPPYDSEGVAGVAFYLAYTTNPLKSFEAFAVLLLSLAALMSGRVYTRGKLLMLILYWTAGVIQVAYILAAWSTMRTLP